MFRLFRRNKADVPELAAVIAQQKRLAEQVDWVEDELRRMSIQHKKLSGRFYAIHGAGEGGSSPPEPNARLSKAEVLRSIGYVPGRPAPHK